jgi:hypothetical protein
MRSRIIAVRSSDAFIPPASARANGGCATSSSGLDSTAMLMAQSGAWCGNPCNNPCQSCAGFCSCGRAERDEAAIGSLLEFVLALGVEKPMSAVEVSFRNKHLGGAIQVVCFSSITTSISVLITGPV